MYASLSASTDLWPQETFTFWKCLQWSCLKAVPVPSFVLGGLRGSTTTNGSCLTLSAVPRQRQQKLNRKTKRTTIALTFRCCRNLVVLCWSAERIHPWLSGFVWDQQQVPCGLWTSLTCDSPSVLHGMAPEQNCLPGYKDLRLGASLERLGESGARVRTGLQWVRSKPNPMNHKRG